jgi:hypothetical protein
MMKGRLVPVAAVIALALLLPAIARAAVALPPGGPAERHVTPRLRQAASQNPAAAVTTAQAAGLAAPRPRLIANGPCTVTGVVQGLSGAPIAGATVDWGYYDAQQDWVFGNETKTAADGSFTFTGVMATTDGELDVYLPVSGGFQAWKLVFNAPPAGNSFTLRPGIAPFATTRTTSPNWNYWDGVVVDTWGSEGGGTTTLAESGNAYVMPPDYDHAVVYYFSNQAVEWTASAASVAAGGTGATPINVAQDDAQSIAVEKPYWASGKPGAAIAVRMRNWPSASQAEFYGYSEYPASYPTVSYPNTYVSSGSSALVSLTIPKGATPGYDFQVHAFRVDNASLLDINDFFQVCTLNSTKLAVKRGGAIRLGGVVPTQNHVGKKAGRVKYVTLFKRTTPATAAPAFWNPSHHGWTKVVGPYTNGTFKANGLGSYLTGYLHPKRTTWYVVRYPGDSWYWRAYTSVLKVRVY